LTATLKSLSGSGGGLLNPARPRSCTQQRLRRFYPKSSGLSAAEKARHILDWFSLI